MCGICGIVSSDGKAVDRDVLLDMRDSMIHRGPDQCGFYISPSGNCGLGHRRLSILDLSLSGLQPMGTERGALWLAYNGEVYNFKDLRRELEAAGCRFHSGTDSEVVLRAYEAWGADCLDRFVGMFAFAVWDDERGELFLARDRMGVKPLYYAEIAGELIFASEIKAFLFHPHFRAELNEDALDEYLLFRYCARDRTLFRGVRQVVPGGFLRVRDGRIRSGQYWSLPVCSGEAPADEDECLNELERAACDNVRTRLIADVPVGTQLSGGIDSSLITRFASKNHDDVLDAFTVTFRESGYSEEDYARFAAGVCTADLNTVDLDSRFFFESLDLLTWHLDEPMTHQNAAGVYLVNRLAKDKVKVLLSGEGADEVFGGYDHWLDFRRMLTRRTPHWRLVAHLLNHYPLKRYSRFRALALPVEHRAPEELAVWLKSYISSHDFRALYGHHPERAIAQRLDDLAGRDGALLEKCLDYEKRNYLVSLLVRQDKMSMANSVEDRVPLIDHRLVELAAAWPTRFKVGAHTGKYMLKRLARRYYPSDFVYRTKAGFGVPVFRWFGGSDCSSFMDGVRRGFMVRSGRLPARRAQKLIARARSGKDLCAANTLWTLGALECWFRLFIEEEGRQFAQSPQKRADATRMHARILGADEASRSPIHSGLG